MLVNTTHGEKVQILGEDKNVVEEFDSSGCTYNDLDMCRVTLGSSQMSHHLIMHSEARMQADNECAAG